PLRGLRRVPRLLQEPPQDVERLAELLLQLLGSEVGPVLLHHAVELLVPPQAGGAPLPELVLGGRARLGARAPGPRGPRRSRRCRRRPVRRGIVRLVLREV